MSNLKMPAATHDDVAKLNLDNLMYAQVNIFTRMDPKTKAKKIVTRLTYSFTPVRYGFVDNQCSIYINDTLTSRADVYSNLLQKCGQDDFVMYEHMTDYLGAMGANFEVWGNFFDVKVGSKAPAPTLEMTAYISETNGIWSITIINKPTGTRRVIPLTDVSSANTDELFVGYFDPHGYVAASSVDKSSPRGLGTLGTIEALKAKRKAMEQAE